MSHRIPLRTAVVAPPSAPGPAGPYSSGIVSGGFLFLAGQAPCLPDGTIVRGTIEEQTLLTLDNLEAVANAAGGSLRDAVKVTVYLADIADWPAMNAVYGDRFGTPLPARTAIQCGLNGFDVEIEAIVAVER